MTSSRTVVAFACLLAVSACGGIARPDAGSTEPPPQRVAASTGTESVQQVEGSSALEVTEEVAHPSETGADGVTSTTASEVADVRATTATQDETIDLELVEGALDDLDDLFGAFESELGSIDLDEGETP
jgi:hypothetical protein